MAGGEVIGFGLLVAHVLLFGGVGYTFYQVRKSQRALEAEEAPAWPRPDEPHPDPSS